MGVAGRGGVGRVRFEERRLFRFLLLVSGFFFLIWVQEAKAGVIGEPTASGEPKTLSQFNLEYNLVQRDMDAGQNGFGGEATSERILLQGIYGLTHFVDLYLRVGVADLETGSRNFEGDFGLAFGGGGRWTLFQKDKLKIGVGIQFLEFFSRDGGSAASKVTWTEIESFLGGSLQGMEQFVPYFGLLLSKAQGKFEGGSTIRSDDFIGFFVGAEFKIYENYYFSSEARIINENSLTLRLNYYL
ncbi:MAG: hypothetical protein LLH30_10150 [Candidatus Manganitrophus sp. SA1]|nr:hypothetical protein [Candidatus Manganitrophus morganii]